MDKIADAMWVLALAIVLHGWISQSVVNVYVDGQQVQATP